MSRVGRLHRGAMRVGPGAGLRGGRSALARALPLARHVYQDPREEGSQCLVPVQWEDM